MSYWEGSNWQAKKEDEGKPLFEDKQNNNTAIIPQDAEVKKVWQHHSNDNYFGEWMMSFTNFQSAVKELYQLRQQEVDKWMKRCIETEKIYREDADKYSKAITSLQSALTKAGETIERMAVRMQEMAKELISKDKTIEQLRKQIEEASTQYGYELDLRADLDKANERIAELEKIQ